MPCRGPRHPPAAISRSAWRASSRARPCRMVTAQRSTGSSRPSRSRYTSVSSEAVISRVRISAARRCTGWKASSSSVAGIGPLQRSMSISVRSKGLPPVSSHSFSMSAPVPPGCAWNWSAGGSPFPRGTGGGGSCRGAWGMAADGVDAPFGDSVPPSAAGFSAPVVAAAAAAATKRRRSIRDSLMS